MAGEFIWYELMTPDVDGSKAFYDSVVGWNVASTSDFPNGYRMIGRSDGKFAGGMVPLTDQMCAEGARPIWLGYLNVDDVDATAAAVRSDGGEVLAPPFEIPGVGRVALLADPVGVPFYVMKPTPSLDDPDAKSDVFAEKPQHVRWNELTTTDQDGSIAFFARHFGWTQEGSMPMGEMGEYKFIQANGVAIGAVMRKPEQSPSSMWITFFGADDIDRATSAITAGGGQLLYDPMQIPGGEYAVAAIDPQGAVFGLVGPRKS